MLKIIIALLTLTFSLSGHLAYASSNNIFAINRDKSELIISDPFIKINRKIYKFNNHIDKYTLKPAAKIYKNYTANWFKIGVNNFISNINSNISSNVITKIISNRISNIAYRYI